MRRLILAEIPCSDEHHCGGCQHRDAGECWAFIDEVGEPTELLMSNEVAVRHEICLRAERAADAALDHAQQEILTQWQCYGHYAPGQRKRDELAEAMELLGIEVPE